MRHIHHLFRLLAIVAPIIIGTSCSETVLEGDWSPSLQPRSLGLSTDSLTFDDKAQTGSFGVIASNIPWQFTYNAPWLTLSPASGSVSAFVRATVTANTDAAARATVARLESTDPILPRSYEIGFTQRPQKIFVSLSTGQLTLEGGACEERIDVECNRDWTCSTSESAWLTVCREGSQLLVSATTNEGNAAREAYVVVSAKDRYEENNAVLKVTQRVANVESTTGELNFSNNAGSKQFTFTANAPWTASCSHSWIDISPESGASGEQTMTVRVQDNTDRERTGYVYINVGSRRMLEVPVVQGGAELSIQPTSLEFDKAGGKQSLSIVANASWSLSTSDSWLHLQTTSGSSSATVAVSADANTGQQRHGIITFSDGSGRPVSYVEVTQRGTTLVVMPTELSFGISGGEKAVYLRGENAWTASTSSIWILLGQTSGDGDADIEVKVGKNTDGKERQGIINIRDANSSELLAEVKVSQSSSNIVITPTELTFSPLGSKESVSVEADDAWKVSLPDWVTSDRTEGTESSKITLTATRNTSGGARTGQAVFMNSADVAVGSVQLSQDAPVLTTDPGSLTFTVDGGNAQLRVSSNVAWTAKPTTTGWLTLSQDYGSGDATLSLEASANPSSAARNLTLHFNDYDGYTLASVDVTQLGSEMSITPTALQFEVGGGSQTVDVNANAAWSVQTDTPWLSLSRKSGTGSGTLKVSAEHNYLGGSTPRTGQFKLLTGSGEMVQTVSVTQECPKTSYSLSSELFPPDGGRIDLVFTTNCVNYWKYSQSGLRYDVTDLGNGRFWIEAEPNYYGKQLDGDITFYGYADDFVVYSERIRIYQDTHELSVSPTKISCGPEASSKTVEVRSTGKWEVSSSASWITPSPSSGKGQTDGSPAYITLNISANNESGSRQGELTFSCGPLKQTVTVTQDSPVRISASPTGLNFGVTADTKELIITANAKWTLSTSSSSWITIGQREGGGNASLKIGVTDNPNKYVRTGILELKESATGKTVQTIDVTQSGIDISAKLSPNSFKWNGGEATLDIQTNVGWRLSYPDWVKCTPTAGSGTASVKITVGQTTSTDKRSGKIEIRSTTDGELLTQVSLEQDGLPETENRVSDLGYTFPATGNTLKFSVPDENVNWTAAVTQGSSWIKVTKAGEAKEPVEIHVTENPSGKARQGEIQITYQFHRYTCIVRQEGYTLSVSTASVDFFAKGGESDPIKIEAAMKAEISTKASWLKISRNGNVFTVIAQPNESSARRSAEVTITLPGISSSPMASVKVGQAGVKGTFTGTGFDDKDEDWNK